MENLQVIINAILMLVIPWVVSAYAWPALQRGVVFVKGMPSIVQQVGIVLANWGLVSLAGMLGTVVPGVDGFGPGDLQALLTAGVGALTTMIFKTGKASP